MKRQLLQALLFTFVISVATLAHAQQISTRYGKVTDEELSMSTYPLDTTATAVVIYNKGTTYYDYITKGFRITYTVEKKIKVLKPDGVKYADISIPYYENESNNRRKEVVTSIEAIAYNLENGKVERTKMKNDYVFRERLNSSHMQVKFSIPAVKEGTVIEYKYKLYSDYIESIDPWVMQEDIPVMYSNYDIKIPEYFKFNLENRGYYPIQSEDKAVPMSISVGNGELLRLTARNLIFTANNLPALKEDSYLWCPDDYKNKINFELLGVQFPYEAYYPFTTTWEKIDEQLLEYDDFGKLLKMRNPFRDEMNALQLDNMSTNEKIALAYTMLKQKVSWNGRYTLFGRDVKKAVKEGTGTNAELNFILMSMLQEMGINSVPIAMSRRSMGILPFTHPSIQSLNTFVVGIQNSDSTMVYLDGSVEDGYINTLPPVLLTNRARVVSKARGEKWVNLSNLGNNQLRVMTNVTIQENGQIVGNRKLQAMGQYATSYRKEYKAAKDSADYIEKQEAEESIQITNLTQEMRNAFSPNVGEEMSFTKQMDSSGDYLYLNPLIFKHISKNPFIQEERVLPVEFSYPYSVRLVNTINIPEGYTVEELPKSLIINMNNNAGSCKYMIQQQGDKLLVNYIFALNKVLFPSNEYAELKTFFETVSEKNNEMIVLKKIAK